MALASLNGQLCEAHYLAIDPEDRGFRFGDGVFETIAVIDRCPYLWDEHLARLQHGLALLGIDACLDHVEAHLAALLASSTEPHGTLRLIVTRGRGSAGYLPTHEGEATVLMTLNAAIPELANLPAIPEPARLWLSRWRRFPPDCLPVEAKIMQGMNATLARLEADRRGYDEALLLSTDGHLAEAASANLFWLDGDVLCTPPLATGCLAGTMRERLRQCWGGLSEERSITPEALAHMDAVVMTNSVRGIVPVEVIAGEGMSHCHFNGSVALAQCCIKRMLRDIQRDRQRFEHKSLARPPDVNVGSCVDCPYKKQREVSMKKVIAVVIVLLVAALGGHYYFWQQQAALFEQQVNRAVERINAKAGADVAEFSYESRSVSGYPQDAEVIYTNPMLTINENADMPQQPLALHQAKLDGTITLRSSLLKESYALSTKGTLHLDGNSEPIAASRPSPESPEPFALAIAFDENSECSVTYNTGKMAEGESLQQGQFAENAGLALEVLDELNCQAGGITVTDKQSSEQLGRIDSYLLTIDSDPADRDDHRLITFETQLDGLEMASNPKDYIDQLKMMQQVSQHPRLPQFIEVLENQPALPIMDASHLGKQDFRLAGTYEGAIRDVKSAPFALDITEHQYHSDLYTMEMPLSVSQADNGEKAAKGALVATFDERYDDMLHESVNIVLAAINDPSIDWNEQEQRLVEALDPQHVHGVLPKFHKAGEIRMPVDVTLTQDKRVLLSDTGLKTELFGLSVDGKASLDKKAVDVTIRCEECPYIVHSLSDMANHAGAIIHETGKLPTDVIVSGPAQEAIMAFLKGFDTDDTEEDITLTVKSGQGGQMMLSGKPLGMAMMQGMGKVAPHFSHLMPDKMPDGQTGEGNPKPDTQ